MFGTVTRALIRIYGVATKQELGNCYHRRPLTEPGTLASKRQLHTSNFQVQKASQHCHQTKDFYSKRAVNNMPPITTSSAIAATANNTSSTGASSSTSTSINPTNGFPDLQETKPVKPLRISVDGNISSGKSTLVATLVDLFPKELNYEVEIVPEPLGKWTNLHGFNLLDMLYKDVARNNFLFQHYVQLTRLMDTMGGSGSDSKNGHTRRIRIMERSLQNNRYCFNELAKRQGTLQEAEFAVLAEWYKWLGERIDLSLDLIVYLRTTPDTVFNRMKGRGRAEESTVPFSYLSDLHDVYEDWLVNNSIVEESSHHHKKNKVIIIDANQSKEDVAQQCRLKIQEFLSELRNDEV